MNYPHPLDLRPIVEYFNPKGSRIEAPAATHTPPQLEQAAPSNALNANHADQPAAIQKPRSRMPLPKGPEQYFSDQQITENAITSIHKFLSVYHSSRLDEYPDVAKKPITYHTCIMALELIGAHPRIFPIIDGQKDFFERKLVRIKSESEDVNSNIYERPLQTYNETLFFKAEFRISRVAHDAMMRHSRHLQLEQNKILF